MSNYWGLSNFVSSRKPPKSCSESFTPPKINMEYNHGSLVQMIFLSKWVICMFHVNLPGCNRVQPCEGNPHLPKPTRRPVWSEILIKLAVKVRWWVDGSMGWWVGQWDALLPWCYDLLCLFHIFSCLMLFIWMFPKIEVGPQNGWWK